MLISLHMHLIQTNHVRITIRASVVCITKIRKKAEPQGGVGGGGGGGVGVL